MDATLLLVCSLKTFFNAAWIDIHEILVVNITGEAKLKLVFIFEQHQISSFQVCTKMVLQNFVRILPLFQHEYSTYKIIKLKENHLNASEKMVWCEENSQKGGIPWMHWTKRVYLENKLAKEGITLMQEKNIILGFVLNCPFCYTSTGKVLQNETKKCTAEK